MLVNKCINFCDKQNKDTWHEYHIMRETKEMSYHMCLECGHIRYIDDWRTKNA